MIRFVAPVLALLGIILLNLKLLANPRHGLNPIGKVTCKVGKCFLRKKTNSWISFVQPQQSVSASLGDVVIGVGDETNIEIVFDEGSISYLRGSGLIVVRPGSKSMIMTQGEESGQGEFKAPEESSKANLFYVGNVPLKMISPLMGEPVLVSQFPKKVLVSVELSSAFSSSAQKLSQGWKLYRESGRNVWNFVESVDLEINKEKTILSKAVKFKAPGKYILSSSKDTRNVPEGFPIIIKDLSDMESEIKTLLKKSELDGDAAIEIRSD